MEPLRRRRHIALFMLGAVAMLFVLGPGSEYKGYGLLKLSAVGSETEPLIFLYNTYFGSRDWDSFWDNGIDGPNGSLRTLRDCPRKCIFTSDKTFFNSTDFVLVHVSSYASMGGKPVKLKEMKGSQIWTAVQLESPFYGWGYERIDGVFHWVASYRQDSDIFIPYGRFRPSNPTEVESNQTTFTFLRNSLKAKKTAVWLVSNHCEATSEREFLVATLRRYIPIDILGKCSGILCPEMEQLTCREYLGQNYKFYLAFENSLCLDYITEKAFLSYKYNMVPVTFGWVNYSQYLPPGSYINALDYDSVEDLARYLAYLDQHDDEYLKYFAWRGKYDVKFLDTNKVMCRMCRSISDYLKKNGVSAPVNQKRKMRLRRSFKRWENSLPAGQGSKLFQVGQSIVLNVTKEACVQPYEYPELQKWIRGGLPVTQPLRFFLRVK